MSGALVGVIYIQEYDETDRSNSHSLIPPKLFTLRGPDETVMLCPPEQSLEGLKVINCRSSYSYSGGCATVYWMLASGGQNTSLSLTVCCAFFLLPEGG